MDRSPQGFPVHGIFQARGLEWAAITVSKTYVTTVIIQMAKILYYLKDKNKIF